MPNTNIKYHIQSWIVAHRAMIEGVAMSVTLGVIMNSTYNVPYEGHFLQRYPTIERRHEKQPTQQEQRMQTRLRKRIIRTQQIVALKEPVTPQEATLPSPRIQPAIQVAEPLRPAASEEPARLAETLPVAPPEIPKIEAVTPVIIEDPELAEFPPMGRAMHPVSRVPDWGAMTSSTQWDRSYADMPKDDYVSVPSYHLSTLTTPLEELKKTRSDPETIKILTAKLYYSTRYFGAYDMDAGEFSSVHPGIDLKLPEGTPFGSIAGGRVHDVRNEADLGLHVIIEHRTQDGETFYSIYGHMKAASVKKGDDVEAGQMIGTVGRTGYTTGAHIHLQVDRGEPGEQYHEIYWPETLPSRAQADRYTINPIGFIRTHTAGQ